MARNSNLAGLFIALEGGEGAGKSTQAQHLRERFEATGRNVVVTYEPGGTALGQQLWPLISKGAVDPLIELFLFAMARAQHVTEVIRPALEKGDIVICDRYIHSSLAYQGYGRGLALNHVRAVNHVATQGLEPDVVFLLDVPPEVGLKRKGRVEDDRIGAESLDFHRRVHEGYLELAAEERGRFVVIDGMQSSEAITAEMWAHVQELAATP